MEVRVARPPRVLVLGGDEVASLDHHVARLAADAIQHDNVPCLGIIVMDGRAALTV
jgi:hypothetical protein